MKKILVPILMLAALAAEPVESANASRYSSAQAQEIIAERARETALALKKEDFKALAALSHSRGVRFSPWAYVNPKADRLLSPAELERGFSDKESYVWGYEDNNGAPIKLDFSGYYKRFVYRHDFAAADEVGYNRTIGAGNSLNNASEAYPGSIIVEHHFRGFKPEFYGLDWHSLRLVFVAENGEWKLSGVINDEWTI